MKKTKKKQQINKFTNKDVVKWNYGNLGF
jgi:hypothetical protein